MATTNKGLNQPALNSTNWNTPLNDNFGYIDASLGSTTSFNVTGVGTSPVVLSVTQYQSLILKFTGTLSANVNYQIPSGVGGQWIVQNDATGNYTLTISSAGGGTTVAIPVSGRRTVYSDGTNISLADNSITAIGITNSIIYNNGTTLTGTAGLTYNGTSVTVMPTTATTNAAVEALRLDAQSSGTPAAGLGPMIALAAETAVGVTKVGAEIAAISTDVTTSSEDFDFVLKLMAGGAAAAEKFRVTSTGTASANILKATTEMRTVDYKGATGSNDALINGITPIAASAVPGLSTGLTLLGTINTTSGSSVSLSSLTLTGYKYLLFDFNAVTTTGGATSSNRKVNTIVVTNNGSTAAMYGLVWVSLTTGRTWGVVSPSGGSSGAICIGDTGYSTSTTSVSVATDATFSTGSVLVYGMK